MYCPHCETENEDAGALCISCGLVLHNPERIIKAIPRRPCPHCGKVIPVGIKECPSCDTPLAFVMAFRGDPFYAGIIRRTAALVVDVLVLAALALIWYWFSPSIWVSVIIASVVAWLYFSTMEASPYQATFGKQALHIHVIDHEGHRLSLDRSLARFCSKIVSCVTVVGLLMIPFNDKQQALHDKIASTYVIED